MDWADLMASAGGTKQCDPRDVSCVASNEQITDAVNQVWAQYMSSTSGAPEGTVVTVHPDTSAAAIAQYNNNQVVTSDTVTVDTPSAPPVTYSVAQLSTPGAAVLPDSHSPLNNPVLPAAPAKPPASSPAAPTYTPSLQFSNTSRTNSDAKLYSGDYWKVSITGGQPNTPVTVKGGQNGNNGSQVTGNTDGSGAYSLSGKVGDSEIGTWAEQWYVGSTLAGKINFDVVAAAAPSPTGSGASTPTPNSDSSTPAAAAGMLPAALTGLPWYAYAGGGLLALLALHSAFSGGGRR
jgi:hypothetical protein